MTRQGAAHAHVWIVEFYGIGGWQPSYNGSDVFCRNRQIARERMAKYKCQSFRYRIRKYTRSQ